MKEFEEKMKERIADLFKEKTLSERWKQEGKPLPRWCGQPMEHGIVPDEDILYLENILPET